VLLETIIGQIRETNICCAGNVISRKQIPFFYLTTAFFWVITTRENPELGSCQLTLGGNLKLQLSLWIKETN